MKARRSAVLLLATGVTCLAGAALPLFAATADSEPGSGLGSFSLAANAPVLQFRVDNPVNNCTSSAAGPGACEGDLNESVSTLRNGPIGHALSSFAWPGTLAGNLGSLLIVLGAPDQATTLNDPVRAENFTSSKDDTVTNTQVPGVTMTATATATKVAATSTITDASQVPALGSFGRIASASRTELTGVSNAVATAHSSVQDVTLGPLHLGAVTSEATATTDGKVAKASGGTTVTGATVNGVPVTIDDQGVHVAGQGTALPTQATDAVNTALSQAGMVMSVSTPIGKPEGADVVYNAGSLVLVWSPPQSGTTFTLAIGGAQVAVRATPGYDFGSGSDGGTTGGIVGGTTGDVPTGSGPAPLTGGTTGFVPGGSVAPPSVGNAPVSTTPAATSLPLPRGLSPWWGVLAVLGSALVMAGLRRLPDRVLVAPASACPQGDLA